MKIPLVSLIVLLFFVGCGIPSVTVFKHDPAKAAAKAEHFSQLAFVQHDPQSAYVLLTEGLSKEISFEKMVDILGLMHPTAYPLQVLAIEFEPILGQPAMNIYLRGKGDKEEFYYRLVMKGTVDKDYRVDGFYRGNGPPPASKLRQPLSLKQPSTQVQGKH